MNNSSPVSLKNLAERILSNSVQLGFHIAAAESLTGGLLADAFVSVPGASRVFCGSAVTYDIHAKAKILGVDAHLLQTEGAVFKDVAMQMAVGASFIYRGSGWKYEEDSSEESSEESNFPIIGLSTTGVAGPGPDGSKPAGLVYVGVLLPESFNLRDLILQKSNELLDLDCVSNMWDYTSKKDVVLVFELNLEGSREQVRKSTVHNLLKILDYLLSVFE
ncbi:CinA family protein [Gardnerella greenwoodii]|uniref:Competence protein n=1 Tax=Gardnerella greenwoodii TaxID=2914925 RepID=A0A2N6RXK0_9BIFI|nr:CinA family protein [Gardnerella greenwoodii]MDF0753696.1 CinA family protein [Gardnerella greenwoodii]PMC42753.1 competence protein [Gardnerella greenwoodii]